MRRIWAIGICFLLLSGCASQETFETIGAVDQVPADAQPWEIGVDLPEGLTTAASQAEGAEKLFLCEDYTVITQIMEGGDLNNTFKTCTGYPLETLQVVKTAEDGVTRYDSVWTCASETGDQVGRIAVLDDGRYHYVLTAMSDALKAGGLAETWQTMFRSFRIEEPGSVINSGS